MRSGSCLLADCMLRFPPTLSAVLIAIGIATSCCQGQTVSAVASPELPTALRNAGVSTEPLSENTGILFWEASVQHISEAAVTSLLKRGGSLIVTLPKQVASRENLASLLPAIFGLLNISNFNAVIQAPRHHQDLSCSLSCRRFRAFNSLVILTCIFPLRRWRVGSIAIRAKCWENRC